jgi:RNA binding exosome subunit
MEQRILTEMAELLNSDGWNYSVFLKAYSGATESASNISDIVNALIGNGIAVDEVRDVDATEVTEEVSRSLGYVGNESAGPSAKILASAEFSNLVKSILESIAQLSKSSTGIKALTFVEGHPAYPVFWDFAFLFLSENDCLLLVGSSSD